MNAAFDLNLLLPASFDLLFIVYIFLQQLKTQYWQAVFEVQFVVILKCGYTKIFITFYGLNFWFHRKVDYTE